MRRGHQKKNQHLLSIDFFHRCSRFIPMCSAESSSQVLYSAYQPGGDARRQRELDVRGGGVAHALRQVDDGPGGAHQGRRDAAGSQRAGGHQHTGVGQLHLCGHVITGPDRSHRPGHCQRWEMPYAGVVASHVDFNSFILASEDSESHTLNHWYVVIPGEEKWTSVGCFYFFLSLIIICYYVIVMLMLRSVQLPHCFFKPLYSRSQKVALVILHIEHTATDRCATVTTVICRRRDRLFLKDTIMTTTLFCLWLLNTLNTTFSPTFPYRQ